MVSTYENEQTTAEKPLALSVMLSKINDVAVEYEQLFLENVRLKNCLDCKSSQGAPATAADEAWEAFEPALDEPTICVLKGLQLASHAEFATASDDSHFRAFTDIQLSSNEALVDNSQRQGSVMSLLSIDKTKKDVQKYLYCWNDALKKDAYNQTGIAQTVVRHPVFDFVTTCVIAANAIWMAIDADLNTAALSSDGKLFFAIGEQFFTFYFVIELVIRLTALRKKREYLLEGWFLLDAFLVLLMIVDNWVVTLIWYLLYSEQSSSQNVLSNLSVLRLMRLLRLARLFRMLRLLRMIPEMLIMVKAIASAGRSVFVTLCLLFFVLYSFGIAFTQLLQGTASGDLYFPTVVVSLHSLAVKGTLSDGPSEIFSSLQGDDQYFALFLFYLFIVLTNITIMNMLTGILCSIISTIADAEKEMLQKSWLRQVLLQIQAATDQDGDGIVQKEEFFAILTNDDAVEALQSMGVDAASLPGFVDVIFGDADVSNGLTWDAFMTHLLQLRGKKAASVKDLTELKQWLAGQRLGATYHPKIR